MNLFIRNAPGHLSVFAAISYALPALVLAPMAISFYVFLPKLFAELGTVTLQSIALVVFLTRVWDAVTDPLIGNFSDRTVSLLGRRKPWLLYSVLPLCLSFCLLYFLPYAPSSFHLVGLFILSALFFLFWTAYSIPYEALGQELEPDYDRRTVLFSIRDGAVVLGTLFAAIIPAVAHRLFAEVDPWKMWEIIAGIYSALLLAFTLICCRFVNDGIPSRKSEARISIVQSFRAAWSNPHFRLLLIAYTISAFGGALPATLFLFYVEHVLHSSAGPLFLALYFALGILALPFWSQISFRYGKTIAWLTSLAVNTGGFLFIFFLPEGDTLGYSIFVSISALGYGASLALPSSMQADILDVEEYRTGLRREGEFLGVWSLAKKTSAAFGAGFGLWLLGTAGFNAVLERQNEMAILTLRVLYCLVPCLCSFAAMIIISHYKLDRNMHREIVEALKRAPQGGSL